MATKIRAIVALGNPGEKFANTRHNIAWICLENLLKRNKLKLALQEQNAFADIYILNMNEQDVLVIYPQTYMNNSGQAASDACKNYLIKPQEVLVIHDEMDLPLGSVRIKKGSKSERHNGLKSVCQELETHDFSRLRIGINRPEKGSNILDYVLAEFPEAEAEQIPEISHQVKSALKAILFTDVEKAMVVVNKKETAALTL